MAQTMRVVESEEQEREELVKIFTFTFGPRTFFFCERSKGSWQIRQARSY